MRQLRPRPPARSTLLAILAACSVAVAVACQSIEAPVLPSGAVRLEPLAPYRLWWSVTEACSGLRGDFNSVAWYTVPNTTVFTLPDGGGIADGAWYQSGNTIVVASAGTLSGPLVRHEMLHALIGGTSGHPAEYFGSRCAGVVECVTQCATEAAIPIDSTAPFITPRELQVDMSIMPNESGLGAAGGWFVFSVTATNISPATVNVRLPRIIPSSGSRTAFGYDHDQQRYFDQTSREWLTFQPGERKRHAFDFLVPTFVTDVRLRGAFAAESTTVLQLTVHP